MLKLNVSQSMAPVGGGGGGGEGGRDAIAKSFFPKGFLVNIGRHIVGLPEPDHADVFPQPPVLSCTVQSQFCGVQLILLKVP